MGDFHGGLEAMQAVGKRFPSFATAQHHLGDMLLESGDIDGAEAAFRRAIASRGESSEGHVGLGRVALSRRDYAAAVTVLEHALSLTPGHKTASFLVGRAYRRLGRTEEANRAQARGEGAEKYYIPDRTSDDLARYSGLPTPRRGDLAQADSDLARAIDNLVRKSYGHEARLEHAARLIGAGKPADAIVILEEMLRERPGDPQAMGSLAVAYRRANRLQDALAILEEAIRVSPQDLTAVVNLGIVSVELEDWRRAGRALNAARELQPDNPQVKRFEQYCEQRKP